MKVKQIFSDFIYIFQTRKVECIICALGFSITCAFFKFVDGISLQAWALEISDAFFRGGVKGFSEIMSQNLWKAPHGALSIGTAVSIPNLLYAIWNIPIIIIHYISDSGYNISFIERMWGKLYLVLFVIAIGYVAFKVVTKISHSEQHGALTAVLIWGSATIMASVGYAMQDEVVYYFFIMMALYESLHDQKNRSLFWMILACISYPLMMLICIPIALHSSKTLSEIIWRISAIIFSSVLETLFLSSALSEEFSSNEVSNVFGVTTISSGIGDISIVVSIILILFFFQLPLKKCENRDRILLWTLSAISTAICLLGSLAHYRFMICTPFIILSVMTLRSKEDIPNAIFLMWLFDTLRIWIMANTKSFLRLYAFPDFIKSLFNIDTYPHDKLFSIVCNIFPSLSGLLPYICGAAFACAILIIYICYPRPNKLVYNTSINVPIDVSSVLWCSTQIVLVVLVGLVLYRINIFDVTMDKSVVTPAIDGINYAEEYYYSPKNSNLLIVTVNPSSTGKGYPKGQTLNLDIIDSSTDKVIATKTYDASQIKSGKVFTYRVEGVDIKKGNCYRLRFYSPKVIDNSDHYMYLYVGYGTTDHSEHHAGFFKDGEYREEICNVVNRIIAF